MKPLTTLLFLSCCVKGVLSQSSALLGGSYTVICPLSVTYPGWTKTGEAAQITVENDPAINPSFPGSSRIQYHSNNRDLVISNVETGDAGTYVCAVVTPTAQSDSVTFTVEVLTVIDFVWPGTNQSFAYIRTSCQSGASVKWDATVIEKNNEEIKLCTITTTNSTGCPVGKEQLTTLFEYIPFDNVMCLEVKFKYELLHSSTGDTPQNTSSNGMVYEIERCCVAAEICDYLFFTTEAIASVIILVISIIYREELGSLKVKIGVSAVVLFVVGIAWFIPLRVSVLPVLPEGVEGDCIQLDPDQFGDQCGCGHPIAFAVIMALLTCVGGAIAGYVIYIDKDPDSKGHDNYEMNDHPKEKNRN